MFKRFVFFIRDTVFSFKGANRGQLLVELLVSIGAGTIFIIAATIAIVAVIKNNYENRTLQTASALSSDLVSKVKSFTNRDWHGIYNLNTGSSSPYYLISSSSSSIAVIGQESALSNDINAGLVEQWKFDEATGTAIYDSSGSFNTGTSSDSSMRVASSSCQIGSCLSFNGSSNKITLGSVTTDAAITVSAWIKTSMSGQQPIFSNRGDGLYLGTSGGKFFIYYNTATPPNMFSVKSVNDNSWHMVSWISNGATSTMYIDGVFDSSLPQSRSSSSGTGYIGWDSPNNEFFSGSIDDVRIYNRALSANEISQIYNGAVYSRYFYIDTVNRNTCGIGDITSSSTNSCSSVVGAGAGDITVDPSTRKITVIVKRSDGVNYQSYGYLSRSPNAVFLQNNWSGGSVASTTIASSAPATYDTASNTATGQNLTLQNTAQSGFLTSNIFDTNEAGGAAYNAFLWQGTQPSGSTVWLQLATSNSSTSSWQYFGPDGTSGTYYIAGPNVSLPITPQYHNNFRYAKYKIYLNPSGGNSPTVNDIILEWSP